MEYLGSKEILKNYKIGFLCSRKVPANIILNTYDWAIEQRDKGNCIISGFHSKIEKDVFDILIKGEQYIIIVLARGLKKRWAEEILQNVNKGRLLVISPFNKRVKRITRETALKRNKVVTELADEMYVPFKSENGIIQKVI